MKANYSWAILPSREPCSVDEKRFQEDEIDEIHGRKPWSPGKGDGIIELNQEMITAKWGLGVIEILLGWYDPTIKST